MAPPHEQGSNDSVPGGLLLGCWIAVRASPGKTLKGRNDMKILDAWNGLKIVKVVDLIKPE